VQCAAAPLRIGPFAELLREPTVVGVGAPTIRKPLRVHHALHAQVHGFRIDIAPGIEFRQRATFGGCFRMQRKMHQDSVDFERLLELFNTHGTEIAPGSDVVCEYLQFDRLVH
jgi:hypothetical protein